MKITSHHLRELDKPVGVPLTTLGYREFTANQDWKRNLISFTSIAFHEKRQSIICGLTAFDTDLMYEFDPNAKTFSSFNYPAVSEKFEIKIHRSLHILNDGRIVGATACLHREDQRWEGPGGRIFILDPATGKYDFLKIPVEHDYIQTITVDEKRGLIYGFTYPVFNFFVFEMKSNSVRRVDFMGSIPHIVTLDSQGGFWATWNNRTHNLFRYDPDRDEIDYFQHNLPQTKNSCSLMYPGAGPIDGMVLGPDEMLYIGEAFGNVDRLNPKTGEVTNLGKPIEGETRIPALKVGMDGRIYGIAGFLERCHLFALDTETGRYEILGHIHDDANALFIGHDLALIDRHTAFIGETDTSDRAGYLWECTF